MKYAYFPGCKIPHHLPEYGSSVEAVCDAVGIELAKPEFNCCGYPVRHENELASIYSAIRNFAVAEEAGLPIMTPCKCCFGNLKYAQSRVARTVNWPCSSQPCLHRTGWPCPSPWKFSIY